MSNLKQKTISGITWSVIDNISYNGINFIIGIILARLLSPSEFGILGMITVFIAVSQTFIESGFSNSIIRKQNCTQNDFSTVFYFNMIAGILLYVILYFLAVPISVFYKQPILVNIIRVLGLFLIIRSLSIVQFAIRTKRMDFKMQTKISIISTLISGTISIYMAYTGWGVWSLVWRTISAAIITTLLLWLWNRWYPILVFNYKIFKEHFNFGYKLLLTSLIDTLFRNINYLVIGKFFSATELGYYTRSQNFSNLASTNITRIISRVSYPALAELQNDTVKLKIAYKKLITNTIYLTFILMIGMAAISKPMVLALIGAKWSTSIIYLQLLCFSAMLYPLHSLNLNMLNVKGRSDLVLKLEVIKKTILIFVTVIAIFLGVKAMLIALIFSSVIAYFINSFWSGKLINYPVKEQISDILPNLSIAFIIGIILFIVNILLPFKPLISLIILLILGVCITITISEIFKITAYFEFKSILKEKFLAYLKKIKNNEFK